MPLIVYMATNRLNGKRYIGITLQPLNKRVAQHKSCAGKIKTAFANALHKYGMEAFDWAILRECSSVEELNQAERQFIAEYNTLADGGHGYNRAPGGHGNAGIRASAETRAKISAAVRGRPKPEAFKQYMSELYKGRPCPEGIRQLLRGRIVSSDTRKKIGDAQRGKVVSEEQRAKIAQTMKGRAVSEETRSKLSAAKLGCILSTETREKIAAAKRGKSAPHAKLLVRQLRQRRIESGEIGEIQESAKEIVLELVANGASYKQIAERFNCGKTQVWKRLHSWRQKDS